jgi:hypothetical protein
MIQTLLAFILFLFSNIFCSFVLMLVFNKYNKGDVVTRWEAVLFGLGIGPAAITLLLYYLLLLLPGFHPWFYFGSISSVFIALYFFLGKGELLNLLPESEQRIQIRLNFNFDIKWLRKTDFLTLKNRFTESKIEVNGLALGVKSYHWWFVVFTMAFVYLWVKFTLKYPIVEHDALEYAIQGLVFARDLKIEYVSHRFDQSSNFYYVGMHGFGFPLLSTWQSLFNIPLGYKTDFFFRLQSGYYFLLIFLQVWLFVNRFMRNNSIYALLSLVIVYWYYDMLFDYHIDSYRLYLFFLSILGLYFILLKRSAISLIYSSMIFGFAAFAHSTAALALSFSFPVLFLFLREPLFKRIGWILLFIVGSFIFGASHYIYDIFFGTGWVFGLKETY